MTIERTWAEWAATVESTYTETARALAHDAFLDIIACMIGGSGEPSTRAALDVARRFGAGESLAVGSNLRLPDPWAALVSGTAAHALDFDDNFAPAVTHATAVLAPALFALADEESSSGADVIDAYIVGLELQARIGTLVNPAHYEKGWHATSTIGTIGTAMGCARLLRLDAEQTLAAMSNAFSMASGSKKQFGTMMKPIHAGLAAKNAVLAARMAQAGISGDATPLSGNWGFAELYGGQPNKPSPRDVLSGVGERLAIESDGLMAKRFPCCGAAHRTLDGLVILREQYRFAPEEVDHVQAFIPAFARANLRFDEPQDVNEARFSLTYCAARVLETGRLTLNDMTLKRVRDPAVRPWLSRFVMHIKSGSVSEELGEKATPAVTRVVLKNGQVCEAAVQAPKGSIHVPFSEAEQRTKFRDCCRWAGRVNDADRLFELARSIPYLPRFSAFTEELAQTFANG